MLLDWIKLDRPKTKEAAGVLNTVSNLFYNYKSSKTKRDSVLTVVDSKDRNLEKAFSNLPFVSVMEARNLNALDVLKYKYLVMTKNCPEVIEKTFKQSSKSQPQARRLATNAYPPLTLP